MAKKKTAEKANLKASPILRSQGEQHKTKSYAVRDDWKDEGVVNTVAFKSVDGEVQDLLVNGEPAGGGGGGDVTTAEVTFINNTNDEEVEINLPFLDQNPGGYYFNTNYYAIQGSNDPIITPLYDGQNQIVIPRYSLDVSGSATVKGVTVTITGNCTITIS